MAARLLVYGVTGYTGALVSRTAAAAGVDHAVAGRRLEAVRHHADLLGLEAVGFGLSDKLALDDALAPYDAVLNCAGPFEVTAPPLAAACLRGGLHYTDLAGEVPTFEALRSLHDAAVDRGVLLMPGAGFGVVPTDVVAARVAQRMPEAQHLRLAYETVGGASRGTLETVLLSLHRPGWVRRGGGLQPATPAMLVMRTDLGRGLRKAVLNPWRADLVSAFVSTAIPNIETYTVFPGPVAAAMRGSRWTGLLLERRPVRHLLRSLLRRLPDGPDSDALADGHCGIRGTAEGSPGATLSLTLQGPDAYVATAACATEVLRRLGSSDLPPGFQSPTSAFGSDLLDDVDGFSDPEWTSP